MVLSVSPDSAFRQRAGVVQFSSLAAPTAGLNLRDPVTALTDRDALILDNMIPKQGNVVLRNGFRSHQDSLPDFVETTASYNANGIEKLLSFSGNTIYDTTALNGTPALLKSGLGTSRWQSEMISDRLVLFSGADTPLVYNGSTIVDSTISGSGLTASELIGAHVHKNRLFAWTGNDQSFWYGGTNAFQGTFNQFDLGFTGSFGGKLMSMQTWSRDTGSGLDDLAVFFMSSGEIFVYQGSDPGDANNWSIVQRYRSAEPIAIRGFAQVSGDIIYLTNNDIKSVSNLLNSNDESKSKIIQAIQDGFAVYSNNYGWEVNFSPTYGQVYITIPEIPGSRYTHYVLNTETNGFSRFLGINGHAFTEHVGRLYFGGANKIFEMNSGLSDDGSDINFDVVTGSNFFNTPQIKNVTKATLVFNSIAPITVQAGINYDYDRGVFGSGQAGGTIGTNWDEGDWDNFDWASPDVVQRFIYTPVGSGSAVGHSVRGATKNQDFKWYRTDLIYKSFERL